jgi:hypothetical protein
VVEQIVSSIINAKTRPQFFMIVLPQAFCRLHPAIQSNETFRGDRAR